jgi:hypothetical protein
VGPPPVDGVEFPPPPGRAGALDRDDAAALGKAGGFSFDDCCAAKVVDGLSAPASVRRSISPAERTGLGDAQAFQHHGAVAQHQPILFGEMRLYHSRR